MARFSMIFSKCSELSKLESIVKDFEIGKISYNSNNIIGEGSSAVVYLNSFKNEEIAVKRFKQNLSDKSILKAANSLRNLNNRHVVKFVGYTTSPSALAFEFCHIVLDGGRSIYNLKELTLVFNDFNYFDIKERLDYLFQATKGLHYLHQLGIKHKDIKPTNLLVNGSQYDICIKIADFNELSNFKDTCQTTTTSNAAKGTTISYLSPEILAGEVASYSFQADIYSLGITIFETLANVGSPWEKSLVVCSYDLIKEAVLKGCRPDLKLLLPLYEEVSPNVFEIIQQCWCQSYLKRIETKQLLQKFEAILLKPQVVLKRSLRSSVVAIDHDLIAKDHIIRNKDPEYVEVVYIDSTIGYGVFPKRKIKKGEFIAAYIGEQITPMEGEKRLRKNVGDDSRGFIYFFQYGKQNLCVDATEYNTHIGRYVNDSSYGKNCCVRVIAVEKIPYICIFALKDVDPDTELRYDYKDRNLPWRKDEQFRAYRLPLKRPRSQVSSSQVAEASLLDANFPPEASLSDANLPLEASLSDADLPRKASSSDTNLPPESLSDANLPPEASLSDVNLQPDNGLIGVEAFLSDANLPPEASLSDANLPLEASLSYASMPQELWSDTDLLPEASLSDANLQPEDSLSDANLPADNGLIGAEAILSDANLRSVATLSDAKLTTEASLSDANLRSKATLSDAKLPPQAYSNANLTTEASLSNADLAPEASLSDANYLQPEDSLSDANLPPDNGLIDKNADVLPLQNNIANDSGLQLDDDINVADTNEDDSADKDVSFSVETEPRSKAELPSKYKKPKRKCPFCPQMIQEKLSRHILKAHKRHPRVVEISNIRDNKIRDEKLKELKREGIIQYNKIEMTKENPNFQGERKRRKYKELWYCSNCNASLSKRFFSSHKRKCIKKYDHVPFAVPLEPIIETQMFKGNQEYEQKILLKLRKDDVGRLCLNDENILYVGWKFFLKICFKKEKITGSYKAVRTDIRTLGRLYQTFLTFNFVEKIHNSCLDMFSRENYSILCESIDAMTVNDDHSLKAGLRRNIYFLLIKTVKKLRDRHFQMKNEELSSNLDKFLKCLKSDEDVLLSSAQYELEKNSAKNLRKPCNLPLQSDIEKIHEYSLNRISELCSPFAFWSSSTFIELRHLTVTRLTLLNGRRGGETPRLTIEEWEEAKNDGWIDKRKISELSESDKMLVNAVKLAYQTGKGNRHLVSLLIPKDSALAMEKLCDPEIRKAAGLNPSNNFVFASTQMSSNCSSGWHALQAVCDKLDNLEKPKLINATGNRHRVATEYAAMNIPEKDRGLFYSHMGHSAEVNKNVYQAPLAVQQVTKMGRTLLSIDEGVRKQACLGASSSSTNISSTSAEAVNVECEGVGKQACLGASSSSTDISSTSAEAANVECEGSIKSNNKKKLKRLKVPSDSEYSGYSDEDLNKEYDLRRKRSLSPKVKVMRVDVTANEKMDVTQLDTRKSADWKCEGRHDQLYGKIWQLCEKAI